MQQHLTPEGLKELAKAIQNGQTHMMDLFMVFRSSEEVQMTCHFRETKYENGGEKLVSLCDFIDGKTYKVEISEVER